MMKRQAARLSWHVVDRWFQRVHMLSGGRLGYAPHSRMWNQLLAAADFYAISQ